MLKLWLLLVLLLMKGFSATKVFAFKENGNNYIFQEVSLSSSIRMSSESFTICSSHKQFQVNENYLPTYQLYDGEKLWFSVEFYNDGQLWARDQTGFFNVLTKLQLSDIGYWIHMCINFDFEEKVVRTSINDRGVTEFKSKTIFSSPLKDLQMRYNLISNSVY